MNRTHSFLGILIIILAMAAMTGCSSGPRLVSAWQDPAFEGPMQFNNVLVMGIGTNPGRVRVFEAAFADQLEDRNIKATPGYTFFPPESKAGKDQIEAVLKEKRIDSLILTRLVGVDRESTYTPGYTVVTPGAYYFNDFYGFYGDSFGFYHSPGYTMTYDVVKLETCVYDVAGGTLVWTGQSETIDPQDVEQEAYDLASIVLQELSMRSLIGQ